MAADVYEIRRAVTRLQCTSCGAEAVGACDCGKPYMPASVRAVEAIKANPEKSSRAIAEEIGVSRKTVDRARESTGTDGPVERVGLDGKTRRMPQRPVEEPEPGVEADIDGEDPQNYRTAFLLRVDQAKKFAVYSGPIRKDLAVAARQVAAVWEKLAQQMEKANG